MNFVCVFSGGGADGSLMIFRDIETTFHANVGLDEVVASFLPFQQRSNMTAADLCVDVTHPVARWSMLTLLFGLQHPVRWCCRYLQLPWCAPVECIHWYVSPPRVVVQILTGFNDRPQGW